MSKKRRAQYFDSDGVIWSEITGEGADPITLMGPKVGEWRTVTRELFRDEYQPLLFDHQTKEGS